MQKKGLLKLEGKNVTFQNKKEDTMFNLVNLNDVRSEMISEITADIDAGKLYFSDRLNAYGREQYPTKLLEAAKSLDMNGFISFLGMQFFNSYYQKRKPKGGYTQAKMPVTANATLCEGEFNRFYIRAVCLKAIALGRETVTVYRARPSDNPRPESIAIENKQFDANKILNDLRVNIGVDTVLGLPPGPNSGMSVKL